VNYLREGDVVYAGADGRWWRELRDPGASVQLLVRGEVLAGRARAIEDDPDLRVAVFERLRPTAVKFAGTLVQIDLAAAATTEPSCQAVEVDEAMLQASLTCSGDPGSASRPTVLLVPGTTLSPEENFDWGYQPALRKRGHAVCGVRVPEQSMGDIQTAAVYIAHAIRSAYEASGRKVAIVGFSQGGMSPRWTLRYFPDTRAMVADLISLAGSHHGSIEARRTCGAEAGADRTASGCAPAIWQQRAGSAFMARLNEGPETYPEVDYTALYTTHDDILTSNGGPTPTSALLGGANVSSIALQSLCPENQADHFHIGTHDPVAYALMADALDHPGPAQAERVLAGMEPGAAPLCRAERLPGLDARSVDVNGERYIRAVQAALVSAQAVDAEPPVACYAVTPSPQ
jgi:hypothetical protein